MVSAPGSILSASILHGDVAATGAGSGSRAEPGPPHGLQGGGTEGSVGGKGGGEGGSSVAKAVAVPPGGSRGVKVEAVAVAPGGSSGVKVEAVAGTPSTNKAARLKVPSKATSPEVSLVSQFKWKCQGEPTEVRKQQ